MRFVGPGDDLLQRVPPPLYTALVMFCLMTGILDFETSPLLLNEPDVVRAKSSQRLSSANDSNQHDYDGDYQKSMDETAHSVGTDQP